MRLAELRASLLRQMQAWERENNERRRLASEIAACYPITAVEAERHLRLIARADWPLLPALYDAVTRAGFAVTNDRVVRLLPYVREYVELERTFRQDGPHGR